MQSVKDWASWQLVKNTPPRSNTLNDRADRLKYVKKNAVSCQRDLKRDRTSLDRAEKSLVSICLYALDDTTEEFCQQRRFAKS